MQKMLSRRQPYVFIPYDAGRFGVLQTLLCYYYYYYTYLLIITYILLIIITLYVALSAMPMTRGIEKSALYQVSAAGVFGADLRVRCIWK